MDQLYQYCSHKALTNLGTVKPLLFWSLPFSPPHPKGDTRHRHNSINCICGGETQWPCSITLEYWTNEVSFFHRDSQKEKNIIRKEQKRSKTVFLGGFVFQGLDVNQIYSRQGSSRNLQHQIFLIQTTSSNAFVQNEK